MVDWTPSLEDKLRELWATTATAAEIGLALGGIGKNPVIGKAHRLQLPPRRVLPVANGAPRPPRTKRVEPRQVEPQPERAPPPPPAPTSIWRHPAGCQWHMGRDGLRHVFCCEPIGPRAGSYCAVHHAVAYRPRSALADAA